MTNVELNKKLKLKARQEVKNFAALELQSLLDHPSIKVEIEFDWTKKSASLTNQLKNLMVEHGVTQKELEVVVISAAREAQKVKAA